MTVSAADPAATSGIEGPPPMSRAGDAWESNGQAQPITTLGAVGRALDVHHLVAAFRRRRVLFAQVVGTVFLFAALFCLFAPPKYTATADVMMDTRKQNATKVEDVLEDVPPDTSEMDSQVEVLKSPALAKRVIAKLALDRDPEFNKALEPANPLTQAVGAIKSLVPSAGRDRGLAAERAQEQIVNNVLKGLDVKRVGLTYVIDISFKAKEPAKAAQIANAYAELYLVEQLESKYEATNQVNAWLSDRLSELRGQVQKAEDALESYNVSHNLLSTTGATLTEQEISADNQSLATARADLAEQVAKLQTAKEQLAHGSNGEDVGASLDSPVIQDLRSKRAEVSATVADLAGRYGPNHPDMLKAKRELQDIDGQIQAEIVRIISNLQAQVDVARQRTESMERSLGGAKGTLAQNNVASVGQAELQRNAEAVRTLYENFLDRFQETSAQQGAETTEARIVSHADLPTTKSFPKTPLMLAIGFALGVGLASLLIVLLELFDSGLNSEADVEQELSVPLLAAIPLLSSVGGGRKSSPLDYVVATPLSSFAESFRSLRASIRYSRNGKSVQTVLVTSALPGEGKTTLSVCLARVSAQAGDRVVIVDCDLRRHSIAGSMGMEASSGLLEVLAGTTRLRDALLADPASGAYVLPLARSRLSPKDVFGTPAMDELLSELRGLFDLVILDTAPTLAVAETRVLASKADAVVFLVRWRKTPRYAADASLRNLEDSGAHIAGVVLTQADVKELNSYPYSDPSFQKYYSA